MKGLTTGRDVVLHAFTIIRLWDCRRTCGALGLKALRERGGFLKLVGFPEQVAKSFRLTMLDRVFELHPSVEATLA